LNSFPQIEQDIQMFSTSLVLQSVINAITEQLVERNLRKLDSQGPQRNFKE